MSHRRLFTAAAGIAIVAILLLVTFMVAVPAGAQTVTPITNLPAVTTPLAGTEVLPIVQAGQTRKATVHDLFNPNIPGPIGAGTPSTGAFTSLSSSGVVSGAGFTSLFASPPPLGASVPAAVSATTLSATGASTLAALSASGAVTGSGFDAKFASPPAIGTTAAAAVKGTTVGASTEFDVNGHLLCSATLPTVSGSGLGTSPSVTASHSCAMDITVGSSPAAASGTITLPTAPNGWVCTGADITTQSTTVAALRQVGGSTTTATIQNFTDVMGTGTAWTAADHLRVMCLPY